MTKYTKFDIPTYEEVLAEQPKILENQDYLLQGKSKIENKLRFPRVG